MSEATITKEQIEEYNKRRRQEAERIYKQALEQIRALGCEIEAMPIVRPDGTLGAAIRLVLT